jgi:hypothetical protein
LAERQALLIRNREEASKAILECVNEALDALRSVMRSGDATPAKVRAAEVILDRALGKPREAPPEPVTDPAKDITPQGLNGSGHKPVIDLEDFRRIDR